MPSKYDKLAGKKDESESRIWNRYGFTELEWAALKTEQREVHYNRQKRCDHAYTYDGPKWSSGTNPESLRTAYSFNPSFHMAHMEPCKRWGIKPPERWSIECDCQMCLMKIGINQEDVKKVNVEAVRLKWRKKLGME